MSVHKKFVDTKPYSIDVMPNIEAALSKKNIKYSSNSKSTEIVIKLNKRTTSDKVKSAIKQHCNIPDGILSTLTDSVSTNGNFYIRQTLR
jgi:hypothetical protein